MMLVDGDGDCGGCDVGGPSACVEVSGAVVSGERDEDGGGG